MNPRIFVLLSFGALVPCNAAPTISHAVVTDVSPRAFRVIWQTNEAAEPSLEVFADAGGSTPAVGATVMLYPDIDDYRKVILSNTGIMIAEVTGLAPDTLHYARPSSRSFATNTSSQGPMLQVRTAKMSLATFASPPFHSLANPVIRFQCLSEDGALDAETGVLVAEIPGAGSPLSQTVTTSGEVFIDTGNLISAANGMTMPVTPGGPLTFRFYRGLGKVETVSLFMPSGDQLATAQDPYLIPGALGSPVAKAITGSEGTARVMIEFPVVPGTFYNIECSESLVAESWTVVATGLRAEDGRLFWEDNGLSGTPVPPKDAPRRFYRAVPFTP